MARLAQRAAGRAERIKRELSLTKAFGSSIINK